MPFLIPPSVQHFLNIDFKNIYVLINIKNSPVVANDYRLVGILFLYNFINFLDILRT